MEAQIQVLLTSKASSRFHNSRLEVCVIEHIEQDDDMMMFFWKATVSLRNQRWNLIQPPKQIKAVRDQSARLAWPPLHDIYLPSSKQLLHLSKTIMQNSKTVSCEFERSSSLATMPPPPFIKPADKQFAHSHQSVPLSIFSLAQKAEAKYDIPNSDLAWSH